MPRGGVAFTSAVGELIGCKTGAFLKLGFSENLGLANDVVPAEMGLVTIYADDGEMIGDVGSEWGDCPGLRASVGARGDKECK